MAYDQSKDQELKSFLNSDNSFKVSVVSYAGLSPKLSISKKMMGVSEGKFFWKGFTRLNLEEAKFIRSVIDKAIELMTGSKIRETKDSFPSDPE